MEQITKDQLRACFPAKMKGKINDELIAKIENALTDSATAEIIRENILGYTHVLSTGKYKFENYINAVKYVSYKIMGNSNLNAYVKTFPEKYQGFLDDGVAGKDIASYVTAYNKSKLVMAIYQDTLVPTHVLNADLFQEALNKQASIMNDDKASFKVQSDAADSILKHTKAPETNKVEMDVSVTQHSAIDDLRTATQHFAKQTREKIINGEVSAKEVAATPIVVEHESE